MTPEDVGVVFAAIKKDNREAAMYGVSLCFCGGVDTCRMCGGAGKYDYVLARDPKNPKAQLWKYVLLGQFVNVWHESTYHHCYWVNHLRSGNNKQNVVGPFADLEVVK